jgi:hypothetical protein
VRGSPDNRWSEVFAEFAIKIRQNLKLGIYDLVVPRYSTTTDDDVAVTQVVLMESVKSYFDYMVTTLCGIPQIRLDGSADDWEKLLNDARALGRFDLQWWTGELVSVLEQFVAATNDNVDEDFWRSIYKCQDESGGPYVNGWINVFFPYLHAKAPRRRKFDVSSQVDDARAPNHGASDIVGLTRFHGRS